MAEFKLGRIRFVWKDDWTTGTTYYKDDIIAYGGRTYLCVVGHTAAADFYTDLDNIPTKWNLFADGQVWKGDWTATTLYKENDIVKYGGYVYICNNGHTSDSTLEDNQSDWDLFAESFDWKSAWVAGTTYKVNDIVKYGGYTYLCNTAHTAAGTNALGLEADQSKWDLFSKGLDWKGAWTSSTRYKLGDVIKYGGTTYVCNEYHTSAATVALGLEADQSKWDYFNQGVEYKGAWTTATRYKVNDLVKNGGGVYICITDHTAAASFVTDVAKWNQFVEGVEFESDWTSGTTYQPGDIVRYGGNTYIAKTDHVSAGGFAPSTNSTDWDLFTTGFRLAGDWSSGASYKVGEIVRNGGFTYVATADNSNQRPPNASYWSLLNEGIKWRSTWVTSTAYILGDAVKYGPNSYICVQAHTASTPSRPDNDTLGTYWNLLTAGNEESVLTTAGDLVYYSGSGPTRLPIGDEGQVLSVDGGYPAWAYFGRVSKVYYVAPHGTNTPAPTFGLTIDQPWASVRYAAQQVEAGTEYPNAKYLLSINRTFIQKEIVEWVDYQITAGTGIWSGFSYDKTICQRDMGLLVDAIVYDISHTGNGKTIEAAQAYFTTLGASYISGQEAQTVAAINYGVSLMDSILSNAAPAANYQTLNGISVGNRIKQVIDTNYTAETDASDLVSSLVSIVTDAITAGDTDSLPAEEIPHFTIFVKTGHYYETLPIIVPANTAVVGDELRGTRTEASPSVISANEKTKSISALQRIQSIVDDIITNTAVTPTTGNSETQNTTGQRAGTGTGAATLFTDSNILEMKKVIELGDSYASAFVYPTPTGGSNNASDAGYLNAARLILANKSFIQDEVSAYMNTNYNAVWTALSAGDKAKCTRDMGYIVDALVYDLTYGGNLQTVIAARAYYSNGVLVEPAGQKTALLATVNRIKDIIDNIATGNTGGWTKSTGNTSTQDTSGTAGSAGAATTAQTRVQEIYDTINTGTAPTTVAPDITWPAAGLLTAGAKILAAKSYIQTETIEYINEYFPTLSYDETLCKRDTGYIIDALYYDFLFGSNYMSIKTASSYRRGITSTQVVLNSQLAPTLATVDFIFAKVQEQLRLSTSALSIVNNAREIKDVLNNGLAYADSYVRPTPTGGTYGYTSGYYNAARLILANKSFLQAEVTAYMVLNYSSLWTSLGVSGQTACTRDIGYIVEALYYDLMYGGNLATVIAARSYYSNGTFVEPSSEKTAAIAVQNRLIAIITYIAQGNTGSWTKTTGNAATQDTTGTAGSSTAGTYAATRLTEIRDTINTGTTPSSVAPETTWVSATLSAANTTLQAAKTSIQTDAVQHIKREFATLDFDETLCSRDVGYIVDALGYDMMFGSNFLSIQNGMAYQRGLSSTGVVLASQLEATSRIIDFIGVRSALVAAGDAVSQVEILLSNIIGYANSGALPIVTGTNVPTKDLDVLNAAEILLLNKEFLAAEATAYINNTYKATVTATTSDDKLTCSSTAWMQVGDAVRFTGTTFGGVSTGTTYYIYSIISATQFKISTSESLTGALDLSAASGSMTMTFYYLSSYCQNDIRNYVEALAYDLKYTGNYKSALAARYYRNALTGSKLEDMYLVRNGCGVRNQTLLGLDGSSDGTTPGANPVSATGLLPANEFGTQRPLAGSYVSLDYGWGPNDDRVWVTNKSTYTQNVTTFGTAAVGQKIDGSLHNGGVDSMVSNDFTQVISDGIGAWVTNLGRAELVSIFTYYAHVGYLAENGGKIRGTNGNNSYGDYGAVAEGVDVTETPITGLINNRSTEADIRNVITDGNNILLLEYGNAGSDYHTGSYSISGAGYSAATRMGEFRDNGVFQVRLTDPGDSSGTGGTGYVTASNQAQAGNTTQITLAAADTATSSAYVGMAVYITAGTGAGQYGYINSYNAGSKVATVYKESTGTAGWDHVVPGTAIASSLSLTSTYVITPRLSFTAPAFTKSLSTLPASSTWTDIAFGDGYSTYTGLSGTTSGSGNLATFDVSRRNGVYSVTINSPGVLYAVGDTVTILGASLGGTTPTNNLTITVSTVSGVSGGITSVSVSGTAVTPKYVAIASGTASGAYSADGSTWTAMTLPASATWTAIAYGQVSTGVSYFVAVASGGTSAAYSTDGINWTSASLGTSASWSDVTYGNQKFVAVSRTSGSAYYSVSTTGTSWSTSTQSVDAVAVTYGYNRFVMIGGGFSRASAYSTDGSTWTVGATSLPANNDSTTSNWIDVAYGNGRYVAISDSSGNAAYSFDGATWTASTLPGIYEWSSINYGGGVFYVTSYGDYAATSEDGVTWTLRDGSHASLAISTTAKDTNPGSYTARTLPASAYWQDVIWTGSKFVAVGHDNVATPYAASSTDGETWTSVTLATPSSSWEYTAIAYNGSNQYIAVIANTRHLATSTDGVTWTGTTNAIPTQGQWSDMIYAGSKYVAISGGQNRTAYSTDGVTWLNGTISASSTEYTSIAYGQPGATAYYVVVTGITATSQLSAYSTDGITWTAGNTLPSADYWSSVVYGNGKFVTVAGGPNGTSTKAAYSSNGTSWTSATMPGAAARWYRVVYGGGAYTAFAYNSTRTAYSTDGITWVEGPALPATRNWNAAAYGNNRNVALPTTASSGAASINFVLNTNLITTSDTTANISVNDRVRFTGTTFGGVRNDTYYWVISVESTNTTQFSVSTSKGGSALVLSAASGTMTAVVAKEYVASALGSISGSPKWMVLAPTSPKAQGVVAGAKTRARAYVTNNQITEIWIHEPGSGYSSAPTMTITDPNNTGSDATVEIRVGDGALSQPIWTNRGTGYTAASATVTGDGYADNYQVSSYVGFKNLTDVPRAGSNVQIAGINDVWYRLVTVTGLIPNTDGTYNATLQLSPALGAAEAPDHETAISIRRRYSQVRLTGHDFLDVGTGNKTQTNYPDLPLQDPVPANETVGSEGGRVFYTSTDQDGNFRVGGLFNVEQSTGVATLNADAFNIAGLNELSLGSVALGGSGATISEFSTDPFFTQDSDSVIPTQRAIKAYITSQIGGGGSSLNVNTLTAGVVYIAGQTIATTTNVQININTKVNFKGGIAGDPLVLNYFLLNK